MAPFRSMSDYSWNAQCLSRKQFELKRCSLTISLPQRVINKPYFLTLTAASFGIFSRIIMANAG
jgi:hypothetical protein